jgi:prepilin-type N-terminal cleavage/methylation domain-containing protein/prepilin-type processing-associated H-X9-DG protein
MRRKGFTLIELMVVIGIVGVLTSLLGPAVQMARSAALTLSCRAKLKSLGLGLSQYVDTHRMYPGWIQAHQLPGGRITLDEIVYRIHEPSILLQILPFIEGSTVYDLVNFSRLGMDGGTFVFPDDVASNKTVRDVQVNGFLCPADPTRKGSSYRACLGVGPAVHHTREFPDSSNGFFASRGIDPVYPITPADISDGLSHTVAFSERLIGARIYALSGVEPRTGNQIVAACHAAAHDETSEFDANGGSEWIYSGFHHTLYTHALPPNSSIGDCFNPGIKPSYGAIAARSNHSNSVNVAMGDGSVTVVSNSISLSVWRALATRDEGDNAGY